MKILITGSSGFIGHALVKKLAGKGHELVGLDSINSYYDVNLKYGRLEDSGIKKESVEDNKPVQSGVYPDYRFVKMGLEDGEAMRRLFERERFDRVCHLAAQAGVRYSLENPRSYVDSNVVGFLNILEACRRHPVGHLVYASSSSVYGMNTQMPFSTSDTVDRPVSLYAASKKSGELMAHTYSHLFNIPATGLRFFTVYGPWGRPDMAVFKFVRNILNGQPIEVYNQGHMSRDFTYIDDIIEGVVRVLDRPPVNHKETPNSEYRTPKAEGDKENALRHSTHDSTFKKSRPPADSHQPPAPKSEIRNPKSENYPQPETEGEKVRGLESENVSMHQPPTTNPQIPNPKSQILPPYKIYNIGRGKPVNLLDFITAIEKALGKEAKKTFLPLQPGDVLATWADTEDLEKDTGYRPTTTVEDGIKRFVRWYKEFYKV